MIIILLKNKEVIEFTMTSREKERAFLDRFTIADDAEVIDLKQKGKFKVGQIARLEYLDEEQETRLRRVREDQVRQHKEAADKLTNKIKEAAGLDFRNLFGGRLF